MCSALYVPVQIGSRLDGIKIGAPRERCRLWVVIRINGLIRAKLSTRFSSDFAIQYIASYISPLVARIKGVLVSSCRKNSMSTSRNFRQRFPEADRAFPLAYIFKIKAEQAIRYVSTLTDKIYTGLSDFRGKPAIPQADVPFARPNH